MSFPFFLVPQSSASTSSRGSDPLLPGSKQQSFLLEFHRDSALMGGSISTMGGKIGLRLLDTSSIADDSGKIVRPPLLQPSQTIYTPPLINSSTSPSVPVTVTPNNEAHNITGGLPPSQMLGIPIQVFNTCVNTTAPIVTGVAPKSKVDPKINSGGCDINDDNVSNGSVEDLLDFMEFD
eukprot:Tbor_TRINITY_DN4715_c0_g5::TRINITY_DN4715_c0_g5_i1::g.16973::m.16973